MKPSEAITESQKEKIIEEATEMLTTLHKHPNLNELLRKIDIAVKEEVTRHPENTENILTMLGLSSPRFSETISILTLGKGAIKEKITQRTGYKYTSCSCHNPVTCPFTSKKGGTINEGEKYPEEDSFSNLVEKYDLDISELRKIINSLKT